MTIGSNKTVKVEIRCSEEEKAEWRERSGSEGLTLSDWMRRVLNAAGKRVPQLIARYSNIAIINAFNDPVFMEKHWLPYREEVKRRMGQ